MKEERENVDNGNSIFLASLVLGLSFYLFMTQDLVDAVKKMNSSLKRERGDTLFRHDEIPSLGLGNYLKVTP